MGGQLVYTFGIWFCILPHQSNKCVSIWHVILTFPVVAERYEKTKTGMILMALTRSPAGVIIFSLSAGVMYSTLFTMPYLLVAHYHASQVVFITAWRLNVFVPLRSLRFRFLLENTDVSKKIREKFFDYRDCIRACIPKESISLKQCLNVT